MRSWVRPGQPGCHEQIEKFIEIFRTNRFQCRFIFDILGVCQAPTQKILPAKEHPKTSKVSTNKNGVRCQPENHGIHRRTKDTTQLQWTSHVYFPVFFLASGPVITFPIGSMKKMYIYLHLTETYGKNVGNSIQFLTHGWNSLEVLQLRSPRLPQVLEDLGGQGWSVFFWFSFDADVFPPEN